MTLKSHAGPFFPNVLGVLIGLISVPVNPELLMGILRLVGLLDLNKVNLISALGGDAEQPFQVQGDSLTSRQKPLELNSLSVPPACIHLE